MSAPQHNHEFDLMLDTYLLAAANGEGPISALTELLKELDLSEIDIGTLALMALMMKAERAIPESSSEDQQSGERIIGSSQDVPMILMEDEQIIPPGAFP